MKRGLGHEISLTVLSTVCLIIILMITTMQLLCFVGTSWYEREYNKYDVLEDVRENEYTGKTTTMDEALEVTETLIDYSTGKTSELSDFYTDREKSHLKDCKELFLLAFRSRNLLLIAFIGSVALVYVKLKEKTKEERAAAMKVIFRTYVITVLAIALLLLVLYLAPGGDFNAAFEKFHGVFFSNDLWLLDPAKDNLINLLVIGFFIDTVKVIAMTTIAGIIIAGGLLRLLCYFTING